jgi:hypothetical protein
VLLSGNFRPVKFLAGRKKLSSSTEHAKKTFKLGRARSVIVHLLSCLGKGWMHNFTGNNSITSYFLLLLIQLTLFGGLDRSSRSSIGNRIYSVVCEVETGDRYLP